MNKLNVLFEDNHIIVVEKPINMLSQSDITKDLDLLTAVKDYVKVKYNKPGNVYIGLIHRLDRPVGGIMVFARTSKAAARLNKQQLNHEFGKKYLAIVNGIILNKKGKLTDKIEKLDNGNSIISQKGKLSILNYEVLKINKEQNQTLVKIELETGRHHQIRVQFSSRGYYLKGDQRYGIKDETPLALYECELSFNHPITGERLTFKLNPPNKNYWRNFEI